VRRGGLARGREGKGGEERCWVGLGKEGIGVWPTQKLSRGAPYGRSESGWHAVCAPLTDAPMDIKL
jgi:hypothetical protein